MNLTDWLDYFVEGLATQMDELTKRGIRRAILARQYGLNERQQRAVGHLLENGRLTVQDFEMLCPSVHRRSLQRDLKDLVVKGIVLSEGATNRLVYVLKDCYAPRRSSDYDRSMA